MNYTLCWNGEAWSIGGEPTSGNDTKAIHRLLVSALEPCGIIKDPTESASRIAKALSSVAGPYAFVFFDQTHGRLYFGRDFLGRRSLLKCVTDTGDLIISSVSDGDPAAGWAEIEADGVYCVDLRTSDANAGPTTSQSQGRGRSHAFLTPYMFFEAGVCLNTKNDSVGARLCLEMSVAAHGLVGDPASLIEQSNPISSSLSVCSFAIRR